MPPPRPRGAVVPDQDDETEFPRHREKPSSRRARAAKSGGRRLHARWVNTRGEQVSPLMDLKGSPTIATGLADLLGNAALEWDFPACDDPGPVADNLVATVERVGVAWCAAHATPAAMRDAVLNHRAYGVTHSNEQVLPLLDVFCGDRGRAAEWLRASLKARGDRIDREAVEFGTFARNLLAHIESCGAD